MMGILTLIVQIGLVGMSVMTGEWGWFATAALIGIEQELYMLRRNK